MIRFVFLPFLCLILLFVEACHSKSKTSENREPVHSSQDSTQLKVEILDSIEHLAKRFMVEYVRQSKFQMSTTCFTTGSILNVKVNRFGKVKIWFKPNTTISSEIRQFYLSNKKRNDVTNNFPFYAVLTRDVILDIIKKHKVDMEKYSELSDIDPIVLEFERNETKRWLKKLTTLNVFNTDKIREINYTAKISLRVDSTLQNYEGIRDSIYNTYYQLKNADCKEYLNMDLIRLFALKKENPSLFKMRWEALDISTPVRVLDWRWMKDELGYKELPVTDPPPPLPLSVPEPE